jgi:hypothetical protein
MRKAVREHIQRIENEEGQRGLVAMGREIRERLLRLRAPQRPNKKRKASVK